MTRAAAMAALLLLAACAPPPSTPPAGTLYHDPGNDLFCKQNLQQGTCQ